MDDFFYSLSSGTITFSILAMMLGFTFSMALDRHDNRSLAVVDEANTIGTAFLRTDLLPEPARADARRSPWPRPSRASISRR